MLVDKKIIDYLNKVLISELTSINQYFLHARMFRNWGLNALNKKSYNKSIQDMKQADELIERVLFLEGLPNLQDIQKLRIGEHTEEMLNCDLALQQDHINLLREAIAFCETSQDYVSRQLLENNLHEEEEHLDWIETQQHLIKQLGIENYQQAQM